MGGSLSVGIDYSERVVLYAGWLGKSQTPTVSVITLTLIEIELSPLSLCHLALPGRQK